MTKLLLLALALVIVALMFGALIVVPLARMFGAVREARRRRAAK